MNETDYVSFNADIWDNINECLVDKTTAISHEDYIAAKNGMLNVSLAGITKVPKEWFPTLKGAVMDISNSQLAKEKYVSQREGYDIHIIRADMSKPFPFADNSFDMIFNPISNCYIEDIMPMWRECARVIRSGGVLMMAFVKEEFFLFAPDFKNEDFLISRHSLPFNPLKDLSEEKIKDCDGGGLFDKYMNSYVAVRAVKK